MRDHNGRRRETTWARATPVIALAANGNYSTVDLLATFKAAGGAQQGVTVTRMHVTCSVGTGVAANDVFDWGIIRGQDTDIGSSIAGAPTALSHPFEDWLMWRQETADENATYFVGQSNTMEWDIRAQRRLTELDQTLNLVVHRGGVAAASLTTAWAISILLKLP